MILILLNKIRPIVAGLMLSICFDTTAGLITIDFENFQLGGFSSGVEDGVLISAIGTTPEVSVHVGSGKSAMSNDCCGTGPTGGATHSLWTFSFFNSNELFTFEQFDIAGTNKGGDHVVIAGFLNGVHLGTDAYTTKDIFYKTEVAGNLNGVIIDQMKITMRNVVNFPHMDNIILKTQVAEPSTLAIFSLAIIGLASSRFKRKPYYHL